jgi:tetratricopeptide (TPR) repeat protein
MAEQANRLAHQVGDQRTRGQALHARISMLIAPNLLSADYEEIIRLANEAAHLYAEVEIWPGHARIFNLLGDVKRMQQRFVEAKRYYEESVQELRTEGYLSDVVVGLSNLGWTAIHMGNPKAAFAYFIEGLELSCDLRYLHGIAVTLAGIAGILAHLEHPEPAARLIGAAEAILKSTGIVIIPSDQPDYESTIVELRAQLGQADFDHYCQTGHMVTVAEAPGLVKEIFDMYSQES